MKLAIVPLLFLLSLPLATAQNALACEAGFRPFDHALLTSEPVCIPENPQRIVAIDSYSLETLLALGVTPVGSSDGNSLALDLPELKDRVATVTNTGAPVDLETLLSLEPDLILAIEPRITDVAAEAAEIAPLVSIDFEDFQLGPFLNIVAQAVGKQDEVAALGRTYDDRIAALKTAIAASAAGETISVVQFYDGNLNAYPVQTLWNGFLPQVGMASLPAQDEAIGDEWRIPISLERLDLLDTDHVFLVTYATTAEEVAANEADVAELSADPLWQTLEAVSAGQVHIVPFYWNAASIIGHHKMLDDLFKYVAGVEPSEVSPNPFALSEEVTTHP